MPRSESVSVFLLIKLTATSALFLFFAGSAVPAAAVSSDAYVKLEQFLRANPDTYRLSLYRTYLPKAGRRAHPLPKIQKVLRSGRVTPPLRECALTRRIHDGRVNFDALLKMLEDGSGDEVDFLVGLARAMRVPVPNSHRAIRARFPFCAWWGFVDERFLNFIFPDATATYWFQPFITPPPELDYPQYLITGEFVEERYKSFALYDVHFNPFEWTIDQPSGGSLVFSSTVTDYQMKPSNGENPFIRPNVSVDDYGQFKVLMKNAPSYEDSLLPDTNVIPMQSGGAPSGTLTRAGASIPLPLPCGREDSTFPCPLEGMPQIPSANLEQGVVSNINNAYVFSITHQLTPRAEEPLQQRPAALVIRGRMPRTTGTDAPPQPDQCQKHPRESYDVCYCQRNPGACEPVAWTGKGNPFDPDETVYSGPAVRQSDLDMRYWSVCTAVYERPYPTVGNLLPGQRFQENSGCVPDSDIIQSDEHGNPDPNGGWFTIVITTEAAKPDIFKDDNGGIRNRTVAANWVQGVAGVKMGINLRNMFANDNFEFAGTRVEADSAWQTTFKTMQDYYPVMSATCSVELINTQGWGACVAPKVEVDTCGGLTSCEPSVYGIGAPGFVTPAQ